jgi:hypothetical protein
MKLTRTTRTPSSPKTCSICGDTLQETMMAVFANETLLCWECLPCSRNNYKSLFTVKKKKQKKEKVLLTVVDT